MLILIQNNGLIKVLALMWSLLEYYLKNSKINLHKKTWIINTQNQISEQQVMPQQLWSKMKTKTRNQCHSFVDHQAST
jgi:hypothetical protein